MSEVKEKIDILSLISEDKLKMDGKSSNNKK